eukprot:3776144-Pleurochrysis_carterae.AAC.1
MAPGSCSTAARDLRRAERGRKLTNTRVGSDSVTTSNNDDVARNSDSKSSTLSVGCQTSTMAPPIVLSPGTRRVFHTYGIL